ncbi:MFS transporter [Streptomyces qaidamensis]|uniref:MFS transporter n=1 Tax=Streptomyces qaidamensis TaxID=1783515 RepID=UPI0036E5E475
MPSTTSMTAVPETGTAGPRTWAAVLALAAATFSVVTTEMLPVGLLTPLGTGLRVSAGTAGLAVTLPGLVAAASAPLLPVAARRTDRRTVLCALLLLLTAANVLSALAPHIAVLLFARALVGVCIGGVWAIAAGLGPRLLPAHRAGRATALIFSGIAVASVLGVPAGTFLGSLAGWRWAFAALTVVTLTVTAALFLLLPPLPPETPVGLGTFARLLRTPAVGRGLLAIALLVTGHFTAYTYVRPILDRTPGLGAGTVSALLLGYGLAGIAGTFAGGAFAARAPRRALIVIAAGLGAVVLLLIPAAGSLVVPTALLVLWGLAYGGVSVSAQNLLSAAAPRAREAGSALFAGVFNTAIALGAFTGGRTADALGPAAVLGVGGGLALLALPALLSAGTRRPDSAGERGSRE